MNIKEFYKGLDIENKARLQGAVIAVAVLIALDIIASFF